MKIPSIVQLLREDKVMVGHMETKTRKYALPCLKMLHRVYTEWGVIWR